MKKSALAWFEFQLLALMWGGIPAIALGYLNGVWTSTMTGSSAWATLVLRGIFCAGPAVFLAMLIPRAWLLPTAIYGLGFSRGYQWLDLVRNSIHELGFVFQALLGRISGNSHVQNRMFPQPSRYDELVWFLLAAAGLAMLSAVLRVRYNGRQTEVEVEWWLGKDTSP